MRLAARLPQFIRPCALLAITLFLFVAPSFAFKDQAAGLPDDRPRSPKAVAALAKYDQSTHLVNDHFDQGIVDANKQLITDLAAAKKRALDSLNLEEAERIDASMKGAATKTGSATAEALTEWIVRQRIFIYDYHGTHQETRAMEFLPGGKIGDGSGQMEQRWNVTDSAKGPVLVISGESASCELSRKADGTFVGPWQSDQYWSAVMPAPPDPQVSGAKAEPHATKSTELPKSPAAQSALKKFDAASEQLRASRSREIAAAAKQLTADLTTAEKDAMKAQDLEEAKRIDKWKNSLQSSAKSSGRPAPDLKAWIASQRIFFYEYRFQSVIFNKMEFLPDGRIGTGSGAMAARWAVANSHGQQVLLISGDGEHPGPCVLFREDDGSLAGQWPRGGPTVVIRVPPTFDTKQLSS